MENENPTTTLNCTVVAIDNTNYWYRICSVCDKTLPDNFSLCNYCSFKKNPASSKRLFRLLVSIATDTKVFVVVMFDRAARVLFGSSADDFFHFAKLHPFSAVNAMKILEGEMLRVTLSKPKNGNAQHQRVVSTVPLSSDFRPIFVTLKELYGRSVDH